MSCKKKILPIQRSCKNSILNFLCDFFVDHWCFWRALFSFQIYLTGTLHLRPRWPCCIISNELLSASFQLFSLWLCFGKSSMSNRWPIWPSWPESVTGAFHHDEGRGWKPACNVCRKSEDTLQAGMKGMLVAPGTAGASRGQHWFILPQTRLHTLFQSSSEGENPKMLFSINGHGRGWHEGGKEVATCYLRPHEVMRSWAISWLHILMMSWVIYLSLFLYQDLFSMNYLIRSQTERRHHFRKC